MVARAPSSSPTARRYALAAFDYTDCGFRPLAANCRPAAAAEPAVGAAVAAVAATAEPAAAEPAAFGAAPPPPSPSPPPPSPPPPPPPPPAQFRRRRRRRRPARPAASTKCPGRRLGCGLGPRRRQRRRDVAVPGAEMSSDQKFFIHKQHIQDVLMGSSIGGGYEYVQPYWQSTSGYCFHSLSRGTDDDGDTSDNDMYDWEDPNTPGVTETSFRTDWCASMCRIYNSRIVDSVGSGQTRYQSRVCHGIRVDTQTRPSLPDWCCLMRKFPGFRAHDLVGPRLPAFDGTSRRRAGFTAGLARRRAPMRAPGRLASKRGAVRNGGDGSSVSRRVWSGARAATTRTVLPLIDLARPGRAQSRRKVLPRHGRSKMQFYWTRPRRASRGPTRTSPTSSARRAAATPLPTGRPHPSILQRLIPPRCTPSTRSQLATRRLSSTIWCPWLSRQGPRVLQGLERRRAERHQWRHGPLCGGRSLRLHAKCAHIRLFATHQRRRQTQLPSPGRSTTRFAATTGEPPTLARPTPERTATPTRRTPTSTAIAPRPCDATRAGRSCAGNSDGDGAGARGGRRLGDGAHGGRPPHPPPQVGFALVRAVGDARGEHRD